MQLRAKKRVRERAGELAQSDYKYKQSRGEKIVVCY